MSLAGITSCAAAAGIAAFLSAGAAQAAMSPSVHYASPRVQLADCAVGFHIGPLGTCVIGTDAAPNGPPPAVIERRATDEGCATRSVKRTDAAGNSETHTATNCN